MKAAMIETPSPGRAGGGTLFRILRGVGLVWVALMLM